MNLAKEVELSNLLLELAPQILERINDALVVVDEAGTIVLVNNKTELLFGYHRTEMLGRGVEILIPDASREKHVDHRKTYEADPRPRLMGAGAQLYARKKNGSEIPVEISLSPMPTPKGVFTVTMVRLQQPHVQ